MPPPPPQADLRKTKEVLVHLASNIRHLPESSAQLLENFRVEMLMRTKSAPEMEPAPPATPTGMSQVHVSRNMDDPPGLHERVGGPGGVGGAFPLARTVFHSLSVPIPGGGPAIRVGAALPRPRQDLGC